MDLITQHPRAFALLALIAYRANRDEKNRFGLNEGEAWIGLNDLNCTEKEYRVAKQVLARKGLVELHPSRGRQGTRVKLLAFNIFGINSFSEGRCGADKGRIKGRAKGDGDSNQESPKTQCSKALLSHDRADKGRLTGQKEGEELRRDLLKERSQTPCAGGDQPSSARRGPSAPPVAEEEKRKEIGQEQPGKTSLIESCKKVANASPQLPTSYPVGNVIHPAV